MERGSLVPPELRHSVQETPDLALELEVFAGTSRRHFGVAADLLCRDTTGSGRRVPYHDHVRVEGLDVLGGVAKRLALGRG